jgi:hypothetical protein
MKKSDWFLMVANIYVAAVFMMNNSFLWAAGLGALHMAAGLYIKHRGET